MYSFIQRSTYTVNTNGVILLHILLSSVERITSRIFITQCLLTLDSSSFMNAFIGFGLNSRVLWYVENFNKTCATTRKGTSKQ